jgi:hypothetical protein
LHYQSILRGVFMKPETRDEMAARLLRQMNGEDLPPAQSYAEAAVSVMRRQLIQHKHAVADYEQRRNNYEQNAVAFDGGTLPAYGESAPVHPFRRPQKLAATIKMVHDINNGLAVWNSELGCLEHPRQLNEAEEAGKRAHAAAHRQMRDRLKHNSRLER